MLRAAGILAAVALLLVLVSRGGGGEPRGSTLGSLFGPTGASRSTLALIDSIGVVVHFNYADTTYGNQAQVIAMLSSLGVHHVRDAMVAPGIPLATGLQAAAREGITATLATGDIGVAPSLAVADSLQVLRGSIEAFEGPNEVDNRGLPDWPQIVGAYMPALAAAVRQQAPGVRVIQPSFLYPDSRRLAPRMPGMLNEHPYPLGGPPEPALEKALSEVPSDALKDGLVFTETGYHNALHATVGQPPVSEQAAAIYLPRLLLADFAAGVRSTFIYELLDEKSDPGLVDSEEHFGLVRNDFSPKPAFQAIRTLIAALRASSGPGHAPWPNVGFGAGATVWQLHLVRPDGSRVLALWRPVSVWDQNARVPLALANQRVDLNFASSARDIVVWRPSVATSPIGTFAQIHRLGLELAGDVVLVSFR